MKKSTLWFLLVVPLLLVACSDESPTDPTDGTAPPVFDTARALIEGYVFAQENLDPEILAATLHEDFRFWILPGTVMAWADTDNPINREYFDRDEILAIHDRLYGELTGADYNGTLVPPVQDINLARLEGLGGWSGVNSGVEFFGGYPGSQVELFFTLMHFDHPNNYRTEMDQAIEFYAVDVGTTEAHSWKLLGIVGHDEAIKATERLSYCRILAMYR